MKTLLLTSAGMQVKDEILKILPKKPEEMKVAYIITASKVLEDTSYVQKDEEEMKALGFTVETIDIEGMTEDDVREALEDKDIVYVQGGNTFHLLAHARASKFDKVVKEFILREGIYIGVSAGTILACPTIETSVWRGVIENKAGILDLTALNLIAFHIFVHYTPEYEDVIHEFSQHTFFPVSVITDDQAILVQDDTVTLVGKGEEVVI